MGTKHRTKGFRIMLFKAHRVNLARRIIAFMLVHKSKKRVLLIDISLLKRKNSVFTFFQSGHSSKTCPSKFTCRECKMKHLTLLHRPQKQLPDQQTYTKTSLIQVIIQLPTKWNPLSISPQGTLVLTME